MSTTRRAQDAPESLKVRVAPLTVTANPKQALYAAPTLLFHWYREPWSDPKIGSGVWAVTECAGFLDAVRVLVSDGWPLVDRHEFHEICVSATFGERPASLQDWERVKGKLASAPVGPTEDLATTVTAQLGAALVEAS